MEPIGTVNEPLVIRQHERYTCRLDAQLSVEAAHADKVVYSRAAADADGIVPVTAVDVSSGGMGIETTTFIPRTCVLRVRIGGGEEPGEGVETSVRVQRVLMTDRKPTYYVGTAFVDSGPAHEQRVSQLISLARRASRNTAAAANQGSTGA